MLNIFPKLALVAIKTYLRVFAKVVRPSLTPSISTPRSFSSNTISAAPLATSAAVSTEIPTSAAWRAEASLMPSPIYPTTLPALRIAIIILSFWLGSISAKTSVAPTLLSNALSLIFRSSGPLMILLSDRPIFLLRLAATRWLSPVIIFSDTPRFFSLVIVSRILGFGGSKRVRNPKKVISFSSALLMSDSDDRFLYAIPKVRNPRLLNASKCFWMASVIEDKSTIFPSFISTDEHTSRIFVRAPFVTISWALFRLTAMLRRFRKKSYGISSCFWYPDKSIFRCLRIASSIGLGKPVW